jgi:Reverse transcriptase (RNA-dependent DNA polymerase)
LKIVFDHFFLTSDQQFGFKKPVGCSHAIYIVRFVVNQYVYNGSAVNLCALDVSKAFDKMNHCGVFIKLMNRGLPDYILSVLEDCFSKCFTCVKRSTVHSDMLKLNCGVRQGSVLSPYLFFVYIDDIIETVAKQQIGCVYRSFVVLFFMPTIYCYYSAICRLLAKARLFMSI